MAIGVEFLLKASTDGFTAGMASANNALKDLKKEAQSWGASKLTSLIGVAGLIQGFRSVLDNAQKSREEIEKIGGTVDGATASVARFADSWDKIKTFIGDIALETVSIYTGVGDGLRQVFQNVSAEEEAAAERMAASTGKSLEETRRLIAKANEENSPEKVNAAWDKALAARRKNYEDTLAGQEKINAMMDDYTAKYEAAQNLDKNKVEYINAQIDLDNQLAAIQKLQTAENAKQVDHGLATVAATQQTRDAAIELKTIVIDTTNAQLDQLAAEKAQTAELQKQANLAEQAKRDVRVGSPLGGGSLFGQASNDALQTIIQQEREAIRKLQQQPSNLSTGISIAQRQSRIGSAQAELDFRESTKTNLNVFGEAGARRMYGGDPLNFDAILSQLRSASGGLDDSKKTQVAIGDIRDVLVGTLGKKK